MPFISQDPQHERCSFTSLKAYSFNRSIRNGWLNGNSIQPETGGSYYSPANGVGLFRIGWDLTCTKVYEGEGNHRVGSFENLRVIALVEIGRKPGKFNRGRTEIIQNILTVSNGGVRKTHIMYQSNLSFKQTAAYLSLLLEIGLLESTTVKDSGNTYFQLFSTTKKGKDFIEASHALNVLLTAEPAHQLQMT
jgi:predicted transcriptional regulator